MFKTIENCCRWTNSKWGHKMVNLRVEAAYRCQPFRSLFPACKLLFEWLQHFLLAAPGLWPPFRVLSAGFVGKHERNDVTKRSRNFKSWDTFPISPLNFLTNFFIFQSLKTFALAPGGSWPSFEILLTGFVGKYGCNDAIKHNKHWATF